MIIKKTYKTIKWVLKQQIEKATKTLWTWKQGKNEHFTCIYKNYCDDLPIYTSNQLLKLLEDADTK
jgi:3-methyladenine DNA glycosylase AlkC